MGGHVTIGAWLIWRFWFWWVDFTGVVLLGQGFSAGGSELVESLGEPIGRRFVGRSSWQGQKSAAHLLKAMPEFRPSDFIHEAPVDMDDEIRRDAEQVCVEGSVMDFAAA